MKTLKYALVGVILCSAAAFSQSGFLSPFSVNQQKTASISADIKSSVDDAKIINVDLNIINQVLTQKADKIYLRVPFKDRNLDVELRKFDLLAPNAKMVAGTEKGDRVLDLNNSFICYTSAIHDKNFPLFVLTFSQNEVSAIIISNEDVYVLSRLDRQNENSDYIFFQGSKVKKQNDFICGSENFEIPERIKQMQKDLSQNFKDFATTDLLRANIAIESDYEAFVGFGGTQNAMSYVYRLFAPVSAIYVRDINVQLQITYMRVWDTPNDPYPDATSSNVLLNAFRAYWNANMQAVPRTLAHMITPRPGGLGGIAWVNVLCANVISGFGYAFSDIDATFNPLPTYSWDVMVVSHETGHNFGSPHTHNCSWPGGPIDSCYAVEGNCYNGPAIPRIGTIMSYCHLNGQISLTNGLGPLPSQLMRGGAENASCMNVINGLLVAAPNGGEIYRFGGNAIIVWGTNLTGNVNIEYSTNNGSTWTVVQNNVNATLRNINWTIPTLLGTTTQAKLKVSESGNPGNSDQSDSAFQIRPNLLPFNMVAPPNFSRYYTSPGDTTKINFVWTRPSTVAEMRYRWNFNNFSNTINYNQFSNNNGADSVASISLGKIDSIIAGWGVNVGDSIRGRWFPKAYSQLDSANPSTSGFLITFVRSLIGIQPISSVIPKEFFVNPNYPNPFNPTTKIKFGLPKAAFVKLTVYDILGREVAILANENLKAGEFEADWDASNFPSGVYFYKIEAGDFVKTSRMVLVK